MRQAVTSSIQAAPESLPALLGLSHVLAWPDVTIN